MNVSISTRQAYSEIDEFLGLLSEAERQEIPKKLREFFKNEKDRTYFKSIDKNIPIKEQDLKEETLAIIALLNLQYWCKDEEEKNRLKLIYAQNEKNYQALLCEKYNSNDIFKKEETKNINNTNSNMEIVEYKETIFKRILNKIAKFFNIR
ncbi:MAG: hypothetical protein HFJ54_00525 [Clostridia bacterium]|nr:hypothetical protein [Clostridia bacterium]